VRVPGLGRRATAVGIAVTARLVVANAVAALFVVVYLTLTDDARPGHEWPAIIVTNAIVYVVTVVVFSAASIIRGKHLFATNWRWLDEARPPSDDEHTALLRQPLRIGLFPLRYWFVACLASVIGNVVTDASAARVVLVGVTTLEGGVVAALLGVLLGDRALRPVFAEALAGHAPDRDERRIGLGPRLVLGWALGTGLPLVGIVVTPFVTPDADLDPVWPMAFRLRSASWPGST
jgi:adenylate cyclase